MNSLLRQPAAPRQSAAGHTAKTATGGSCSAACGASGVPAASEASEASSNLTADTTAPTSASTSVPTTSPTLTAAALNELAMRIKHWGRELGFDAIGISDIDLSDAEAGLQSWLEAGYHGEMDYMEKHGLKRARPAELVPGTLRVISVRLPYLPASLLSPEDVDAALGKAAPGHSDDWRNRESRRLQDPMAAVVSVYARGRDYHKVLRQRLQRLADRVTEAVGPFGYRVFTDSAPVMEVELARRAGVGWRGKHTLLLARDAGSFFFIGELFVDIPLPADAVDDPRLPPDDGAHCGQCTRCIDACPTGAIVAPYRLDARRCISYLTIEYRGSIPEPMREAIGNRIYGCDDCQTACPWNKFAHISPVPDFDTRNGLDSASLIGLFGWSAEEFDARLAGTAIRRIGHEQWLRNIAVAMGNALRQPRAAPVTAALAASPIAEAPRESIVAALRRRAAHPSPIVREHIEWALLAADPIR